MQMNSGNTLYFEEKKLLKVEEIAIQADKEIHFHWYFENGKPIYNTMQYGRAAERTTLLLTLADSLLKLVTKQ